MEKNNTDKRMVELRNSFENVWESICGKSVELETEDLRTPFVVKARMAKRRGSLDLEKVLVFARYDNLGGLKECSRCYACNWGFYLNDLGVGQRIGMYTKTVDLWASFKS
jgi:hypothetical protein